jgi:regulatory protein
MPIITAVKQQQKRSDRYSIFIDGHYALSLSEEQLQEERLLQGAELDQDEVLRLMRQSEYGKILDRCYNYISFRPRSSLEIVQYLQRRKCDDDLIQAVVDRLTEQDILNDERFAQQWAQERSEFNLHSRQRLQLELRQKGIEATVIERALGGLAPEGEIGSITQLVEQRHLRRRYPDERKLIQFLQGKGFRYSDIKAALEQLLET